MTTKNRTLVKLDDRVIEITQGENGLEAKALSEQELFDVSILDKGVEKLIENDINRISNQAYEELKQNFKNNLKRNILQVVGFTDQWGGNWEVDHCNGRTSAITGYISQKVQSIFVEEYDKLLQPEIEATLLPVKQALIKSFKEQFEREAHRKLCEAAIEAAKAFVVSVMETHVVKLQKTVLKKAQEAFLGQPEEES